MFSETNSAATPVYVAQANTIASPLYSGMSGAWSEG